MQITRTLLLALTVMVWSLTGCGGSSSDQAGQDDSGPEKPTLAYVTNGVDPFWDMAAKGVEAGARDFDANCEVVMPAEGITDQKRMVESLLSRGIDGIAISPIDADNQTSFINEMAQVTRVITHDSDAPNSNRLCFVGMNNYAAGRAAGRMVKEVLPEGGEVMLFVGRLEQLNAQQRRQGVIDELLNRPEQNLDNLTFDPNDGVLEGDPYTILDTRTDNFDYSRAKSNTEDAMTAYPNLKVMVGLFAYNTPNNLEAVKEAGKLGEIKMVSFDEADAVLQGISEGHVYGTISQQPYEYGYHSVRILSALSRGDQSVLPENGFLEIPIVEVREDNIADFWAKIRELKGETAMAE